MRDTLIKIRRGVLDRLPHDLEYGEPAWTTDDERLYIGGTDGEPIPVCKCGSEPMDPTLPRYYCLTGRVKSYRRDKKEGYINSEYWNYYFVVPTCIRNEFYAQGSAYIPTYEIAGFSGQAHGLEDWDMYAQNDQITASVAHNGEISLKYWGCPKGDESVVIDYNIILKVVYSE